MMTWVRNGKTFQTALAIETKIVVGRYNKDNPLKVCFLARKGREHSANVMKKTVESYLDKYGYNGCYEIEIRIAEASV